MGAPHPHRDGARQAKEEAWSFFREAVARAPEHWSAHANLLQFVCEKWHGSHDEAHQFAREAVARAGAGSDLAGILFRAHVERWLYAANFDDDKPFAESYLEDPDVARELLQAHAQSLGSPALRERASTIYARNAAAFWFHLAKDRPRLREQILKIGNAYSELPWAYSGEAERVYAAASKWAFSV